MGPATVFLQARKTAPTPIGARLLPSGKSIEVLFTQTQSSGLIGNSSGSTSCSLVFENTNLGLGAMCRYRGRGGSHRGTYSHSAWAFAWLNQSHAPSNKVECTTQQR